VGERDAGADGVYHGDHAAGFHDPCCLAQAGVEVAPVMGAEAAEHHVEAAVLKGQAFDCALLRGHIVEPPLLCRSRHEGKHFRREVVGNDPPHERCDIESDVAATATEIEHADLGPILHQGHKRIEIGALRMHRTVEIGFCAGSELASDQGFVGLLRHRFPPMLAGCGRFRNTAGTLVSDSHLYWYKSYHDPIDAS